MVVVSSVLDLTHGAIGLHQRVVSVDRVTVAALVLGLVVTGVRVRHGVCKVIFGVSLE